MTRIQPDRLPADAGLPKRINSDAPRFGLHLRHHPTNHLPVAGLAPSGVTRSLRPAGKTGQPAEASGGKPTLAP